MKLTGYLSEFSITEIFQFVEQGYKTGLLSLQPEPDSSQQQGKVNYLWLQEGRIVAAAENLDNKRLLSMIKQRGWLNHQVLSTVRDWSEAEQPLGLYLKAQGTITAEQLQLLFHAQVLQPVCALFKWRDASFAFDTKATMPNAEMTGLSLSTTEASLLGLRVLRDWTAWAEKLPNPTTGLTKAIAGKPQLQLDSQEWQVWDVADGSVCIEVIAKRLQLPVETVQKIAFRMTIVGLLKEVAVIDGEPKQEPVDETMAEHPVASTNGTSANQSFMQNLVGLLNTKIV